MDDSLHKLPHGPILVNLLTRCNDFYSRKTRAVGYQVLESYDLFKVVEPVLTKHFPHLVFTPALPRHRLC